MGQNQKEANQAMLHKKNTANLKCVIDREHRSLEIDNSSLLGWEEFLESEAAAPPSAVG